MQSDRIRWWPLYHEDQECVGKIQLFIGSTITQDETNNIKVSVLTTQISRIDNTCLSFMPSFGIILW